MRRRSATSRRLPQRSSKCVASRRSSKHEQSAAATAAWATARQRRSRRSEARPRTTIALGLASPRSASCDASRAAATTSVTPPLAPGCTIVLRDLWQTSRTSTHGHLRCRALSTVSGVRASDASARTTAPAPHHRRAIPGRHTARSHCRRCAARPRRLNHRRHCRASSPTRRSHCRKIGKTAGTRGWWRGRARGAC